MARLVQYSDIENAYDDPERVARLAGLVNELRDGETIVVGTGDTLAPGVYSLATRGGCALPFFEAIRPDAETFGNHDFDYGLDRTLEIVGESPQEWISANVFSEGDRFGVAEGVESSTVIETAGGTRVGFVGVTHPATTDMTPAAGALSITDPIEAIETVVEKLRPRVEFVCVLSHCGALDDEIARQCDVDCVLGGHVHDERISTVAGTICTRPNANGHRVCAVDLDAGTATFHETAAGPIDEVLRHRYETMRENAGLDEVVAAVEEPIERSRSLRLGGECRAGNFVADAYRWAAETDCALQNAGGIRDGPPLAGEIEVADLVSLVPFGERVVVCEIRGRELHGVLADAYRSPHGEPNWYAHVSGLRVVYDTTTESVAECSVGGEALDPDRTYSLATNAYLLGTPHEFPTLIPAHRVGVLDTQWKELAAYAREHGIAPHVDGRVALR
ncbi:bifunctional metallophosphatase/5'-nucleotidase [Halobacteriales archaeon QH_6_64_20]|nr:MAG: bifunctional metallophosphatase/5'-nucleotidase [Halobacteriales archaeon QH_6_64_20]